MKNAANFLKKPFTRTRPPQAVETHSASASPHPSPNHVVTPPPGRRHSSESGSSSSSHHGSESTRPGSHGASVSSESHHRTNPESGHALGPSSSTYRQRANELMGQIRTHVMGSSSSVPLHEPVGTSLRIHSSVSSVSSVSSSEHSSRPVSETSVTTVHTTDSE